MIRVKRLTFVPMPALTANFAAEAFATPEAVLGVVYAAQSQDNWCWAACGEMLFGFLGPQAIPQCALASAQFSLTCCGTLEDGCDTGCWPDTSYNQHGLAVARYERPFTRGEVDAELAAGRPVQVCYQWAGGGGTHVALIVGNHATGDVEVFDPHYGHASHSFDDVVDAYGLGDWIYTFTF